MCDASECILVEVSEYYREMLYRIFLEIFQKFKPKNSARRQINFEEEFEDS